MFVFVVTNRSKIQWDQDNKSVIHLARPLIYPICHERAVKNHTQNFYVSESVIRKISYKKIVSFKFPPPHTVSI
jgi:hypothetical protein